MFEGFKPTKKEAEAILRAHDAIEALLGHDHAWERFTKEEARGYGNASDRVPLAVARGMMGKWFLQGVREPNALLRDTYDMRPAAIYAQGSGCYIGSLKLGQLSPQIMATLLAGETAYDAAFNRMRAKDTANLGKALDNAR